MAPTIAILKRIAGGTDVWGGHGVRWFQYTGPASYTAGVANGDEIDSVGTGKANQTGLRTIVSIIPTITFSGTFSILFQPGSASLSGAPFKWFARWIVISTGVEVAGAVNLSAETAILTIIGD